MGVTSMYNNGLIWLGNTDAGEQVCLLPGKANRHGLVAGATGTGKTVTLKVMAESFSDMGVPVFMADVKGDLASIMKAGTDSEDMQERIRRFGLAEAGFNYQGYPVNIWDIYGKNGIQLRTTISEMGPMLLSRILNLNALQTDLMSVVFKIADDNNLLLELDYDNAPAFEGMHFGIGDDADAAQQHQEESPEKVFVDLILETIIRQFAQGNIEKINNALHIAFS